MVSARINVADHTPLAATRVQRLATDRDRVVYAWSHAKFAAVTRVAATSATSLVCLASRTAPGLVRIEALADCLAQYPVTCFHALNAAP